LGVLVALVAASGVAASEWSPEEILEQVKAVTADPTAAVRVTNFRLRSGPATVHLIDGVLVPSSGVGALPAEFAFAGSGRIELAPSNAIERGQLELFTGSEVLDEAFRSAVFVIAFDDASEALLRLPSTVGDERIAEATRTLVEWQESAERRLLDVEGRMLADAVGSPIERNYFCGFVNGQSLGRFLYLVDPLSEEQVTLGQFIRPDLTRREQRQARRHLEREQREGTLIGLELEDLGIWDTWVSTVLQATDGTAVPGSNGFETLHYQIDVTLKGDQLELEATARIEFRVLVDGLRAVSLDMNSDLEPIAVRDADGRSLVFHRTRSEITVVLTEPVMAGATTSVEVEYVGQPLARVTAGAYALRSTLGWYPRAALSRATYDVTIRWPDRLDLFASGRVIERGLDDEGFKWQRTRRDLRTLGFSFEVGQYQVLTGTSGRVAVTVAIDRIGQQISRELAAEVLEAVQGSLAYFEQVFGPYPLDELTVVSAPRAMSQGLLGFVTLSTAAIQDWEEWGQILGFEDRRTIIAHEVSHQWWGNLVGWSGYRDQWISEAMANYAALLYARNRLSVGGQSGVRIGPTRGWQAALLRPTAGGRSVESLGPVVLGNRLSSSREGGAYVPIVYKKGAVVLEMLARYFSEELFVQILREVVRVASDRTVSTADFLHLVERIGNTDLDWFARQYVYGTGMPEIEYEYRVVQGSDSDWLIEGEARQRAPYHFHYRLVRRPDGNWDVGRRADQRIDVGESVLAVPLQIGVVAEGQDAGGERSRAVLTGRLMLAGAVTPYRFELDQRPEILWLDREGEVFGLFLSVNQWPRRTAYQRGLELAASETFDDAEAAFREALEAEVAVIPERWQGLTGDYQYEDRLLSARIRLALARLHLDTDRDGDAAEQLRRARDEIPGGYRRMFEADLVALDARLGLRAGRVGPVFRSLRRAILKEGVVDTVEGYALLAAAARESGQLEVSDAACSRAARGGADVSLLGCS
jgi:hypothetical protein